VRWLRFLLIAVLAVLAQATLMRLTASNGVRPSLLLAVLVVFGLGVTPGEGFVAGLILGLGRDLFTVEPLGLGIGLFAVMGFVLGRLGPEVPASHPVSHAMFGFVCSAVMSVASALATGRGGPGLWAVAKGSFWTGVGTALTAVFVGALVWSRARWFGLRRHVEYQHV
jgi:rod shape-determining protein MreD